jgi:hypothetical protein
MKIQDRILKIPGVLSCEYFPAHMHLHIGYDSKLSPKEVDLLKQLCMSAIPDYGIHEALTYVLLKLR